MALHDYDNKAIKFNLIHVVYAALNRGFFEWKFIDFAHRQFAFIIKTNRKKKFNFD